MARALVRVLALVLGCVTAPAAFADDDQRLAGSWRMTVSAEVPPLGTDKVGLRITVDRSGTPSAAPS
jgi:hypothetical protein